MGHCFSIQQKKIGEICLTICGHGTEIMKKVNLPTALVSFRDPFSHLQSPTSSLPTMSYPKSCAIGCVVIVHLEGPIFGLLSIKKEFYGRRKCQAELLAFNRETHCVQEQIYSLDHVRVYAIHIVRYIYQFGNLTLNDLYQKIKKDMESAKFCFRRNAPSPNEDEWYFASHEDLSNKRLTGDHFVHGNTAEHDTERYYELLEQCVKKQDEAVGVFATVHVDTRNYQILSQATQRWDVDNRHRNNDVFSDSTPVPFRSRSSSYESCSYESFEASYTVSAPFASPPPSTRPDSAPQSSH